MYRLFISYNRKNQAFVKNIVEWLTTENFSNVVEVFFDGNSLNAGDEWVQKIDKALSESSCCLVFIGEDGIGAWQNKEVLKAVNRCVSEKGEYKIIPLILPHENKSISKSFPWFLADYQWIEFNDPDDQLALESLKKGIQVSPLQTEKIYTGNPYKGLDYFEEEDYPVFFGRTFDLNWVFYKKIRFKSDRFLLPFLAIVGDSGSGKSSFARAGIFGSLRNGMFQDSVSWKQIIVQPGDRPLLNLSTSLQKENLIHDSASFDKAALEDNDYLRRVIQVYNEPIVILIDQFEETLTQCKDENERSAYLGNLAEAVKSGRILLLIALRSDYYASFSKYPLFADLLETNNYTLSGLDFNDKNERWQKQIEQIIQRPANMAGYEIEPGLTKMIIEDTKEINGLLPILEMTLSMLWREKGSLQKLMISDYNKLSEGKGIERIIEKHAENVFKDYTSDGNDTRKTNLLKNIFLRLIELTESKEDVRRTVEKKMLVNELENSFSQLEIEDAITFLSGPHSRLLKINEDDEKRIWIGVVHEVLIRQWRRLREWVENKRDALKYKISLEESINDWKENKKNKEYIYRGKRLKKAERWLSENDDLKTKDIFEFIKICRRKERTNKAISTAILIIPLATLLIFLFLFPPRVKYTMTDVYEGNAMKWKTSTNGRILVASVRDSILVWENTNSLKLINRFFAGSEFQISDKGNWLFLNTYKKMLLYRNIPDSGFKLAYFINEPLSGPIEIYGFDNHERIFYAIGESGNMYALDLQKQSNGEIQSFGERLFDPGKKQYGMLGISEGGSLLCGYRYRQGDNNKKESKDFFIIPINDLRPENTKYLVKGLYSADGYINFSFSPNDSLFFFSQVYDYTKLFIIKTNTDTPINYNTDQPFMSDTSSDEYTYEVITDKHGKFAIVKGYRGPNYYIDLSTLKSIRLDTAVDKAQFGIHSLNAFLGYDDKYLAFTDNRNNWYIIETKNIIEDKIYLPVLLNKTGLNKFVSLNILFDSSGNHVIANDFSGDVYAFGINSFPVKPIVNYNSNSRIKIFRSDRKKYIYTISNDRMHYGNYSKKLDELTINFNSSIDDISATPDGKSILIMTERGLFSVTKDLKLWNVLNLKSSNWPKVKKDIIPKSDPL